MCVHAYAPCCCRTHQVDHYVRVSHGVGNALLVARVEANGNNLTDKKKKETG